VQRRDTFFVPSLDTGVVITERTIFPISLPSLKVDEICKSIAKYEGTVVDLRRQAEELIQLIPSQKDQVCTCVSAQAHLEYLMNARLTFYLYFKILSVCLID